MFPTWRLKIRAARIALNDGRPEEAGQILQQESVRDFLPAKRLSQEVASHLVNRSQQHLEQGDSLASWSDLEQAARLGGCEEQVAELKQAQAERGIERVRSLLIQGETTLAARQITRLQQRQLGGSQCRAWGLIVQLIADANDLAMQGKASSATELLERAAKLLPDPADELATLLTDKQQQLHQQAEKLRQFSGQLHEALTKEAWTEVLTTAEAMLEMAPQHTAARQARQRAWDAVGMSTTQVFPQRKKHQRNDRLVKSLRSTHAWTSSAKVDTKAMNKEKSKRYIAWIDGVGGYMICLGNELMLGQPAGSGSADIPILADLSRRHASICRDGESYVITPIHRVRVDGVEAAGPTVLKDGVLIELGDTVQLRFRKPHALSGTAVLTLESHHKTDPAVDSIVLMSESCVLGSQQQSHITCRDWTDDIVLFRRDEGLQFRTAATIEVDGEPSTSGGVITDNTRINSERFTLSFEEV